MEEKDEGLRLLKNGHQGLFRCVIGKTGLILLLLIGQVLFVMACFLWYQDYTPQIFNGHTLIAIGMVIYLLNSRLDPTAKITWLVLIIPLPLFGTALFLFTQSELGQKAMKVRLRKLGDRSRRMLRQDPEVMEALRSVSPGSAALASYVTKSGCYPVFDECDVTYFPLGEDMFRCMLQELEKAERYIYLEYFIIDEGLMWGKILEILARKAAQGVDVKVMYDGTCELTLLPRNYPSRLWKLGIECKVFSPVTPFVSTHYNYRDHRKILVIDGHTAFNGGINLADEYIGHIQRFGHWKDTAVMVKGEAARSFAVMFLRLWDLNERKLHPLPKAPFPHLPDSGFVMPYADDPLDGEKVGRQVYIDILNRATRYVHIMTPYLILDGEMENALCYAAKRGVEVSLLLPGIPDKKIPYAMAKTHYRCLLEAGVKIYEYSPGFVHAKVFVSDDREAVVGTINLDYRSLYHHFECGTYLYGVPCIRDIQADFRQSIAMSKAVTECKEKWYTMLLGYAMKLVAPLM